MFIHEKILAGEICNECHHKTSKHKQVCFEKIFNGVAWTDCKCPNNPINLRLAFKILEIFYGTSSSGHAGFSMDAQIRRCGFCSCDICTHIHIDEFWEAGKCENPYCSKKRDGGCKEWILSEVFI